MTDVPSRTEPPLPLAEPADVGMSADRLNRLTTVFDAAVQAGRIPGAVIAVARGGHLVHLEALGHQDPKTREPMAVDTVHWIASMTKPLTVAVALALVEEGLLDLAAPVEQYLPQLADRTLLDENGRRTRAEEQPTVLDLMRHTSGIVEGLLGDTAVHRLYAGAVGDGMTDYTGQEFIDRLADVPLLHLPGAMWHYGWGIDLLGLIIESLSGHALGTVLATKILHPLGMPGTGIGAPFATTTSRSAQPLARDPDTSTPLALPDLTRARFHSGGAGAVGTAGDYLRFAQMLLNGGTLDGRRVLGRKTVEYMLADHLAPHTDDRRIGEIDPGFAGYGFGLGVAVRRRAGVASAPGSVGEVSWPGAAGTYWWADPREELAAVLMTHTLSRRDRKRNYQLVKTLVCQALDG